MKNKINIGFLLFFTSLIYSQNIIHDTVLIENNTVVTITDDLKISENGELLNDGRLYLASNLDNEGTLSFLLDNVTSKIFFNGGNQNFTGAGFNRFYNLTFNNESTFLNSAIQIDNDTDFTKGIITNRFSDGKITFNELSGHINTSDISFVDGTVTKIGNLSFDFPIGNENAYRKLSIENLTTTNSFSSAYKFENSNILYPHEKKSDIIKFIDTNEYWEIKQNAREDFIVVAFERKNNYSSQEILSANISELHVVRWDFDKQYWLDEGSVETVLGNSIKTISKIKGHGIFALATIYTEKVFNGDFVIYNNLTPNGDGINDFLFIDGIEKFPENTVTIVNRWGVEVSKINGYNNNEKVFRGYSSGSLTLGGSNVLPSGTYFYIIQYTKAGGEAKKIDYLYINGK